MAQCQSEPPDSLKVSNAKHEARVHARDIPRRRLFAADPLRRAGGRRLPITVDVGNREVESRVRRIAGTAGGRESPDTG